MYRVEFDIGWSWSVITVAEIMIYQIMNITNAEDEQKEERPNVGRRFSTRWKALCVMQEDT
jgi:hypothetical protein